MKGLKETTIKELAEVAKSEITKLDINYIVVAAACGISEGTVKNALLLRTKPSKVSPEKYITIMSYLGIHVEIVYSPDTVQYFYKKLKDPK